MICVIKIMTRLGGKGEKKAECLDDTSPDEMEEDVSDKKNDEIKEAECLDDNSIDEMEEEVSDINYNKNENIYTRKERLNA